ncbi:hypothetical protein [Flavilitoribacter nigricans]|uniref:Outer membrane protein beta-barrel domain-containing protein n=1 Tax=Flavilitoribacter nigricans (strain ATCC 23147 / DSM 23189 / NBRC 102662 / NCIMB 1420 / SS-2) TaxID=1122177 RepID=A0A2D0NHN7_FLAN2|nr:hypothetical protein [Flavilitoribacter nigricans]PHN07997.1 hypothetical protein CRP01_04375 [Flavilitoribacter nigricans DSM 23189 = NBRC 102662]
MFQSASTKLVLLFIMLPIFTFAQQEQDSTLVKSEKYRIKAHDLIIGNHLIEGSDERFEGAPFYFLELGYARSVSSYNGEHSLGTTVMSITQSFAINREFVTATRVGMSVRGWLASMGLYLNYYTDFEYGNLKIAPEFGMGFPNFKAVMGFNIPTVYNKDFDSVQHGMYQFTVNFNLPLAKKRFDYEEQMAP